MDAVDAALFKKVYRPSATSIPQPRLLLEIRRSNSAIKCANGRTFVHSVDLFCGDINRVGGNVDGALALES